MKKLILISSILFLFPVALLAQYPDWIQLSNGNNVQALADGENHLWIGTFVGLMKLNKTTGNMTFYNTANSKLPHNWVRALATDKKGNAWIGTGNGLVKLDGSNWEVFQYSWSGQGLPGMYVQALAFDPAGNLWIGSYGLAKFDGTNWTVYQTDNSGIPSDYPDVLAIELNGTVWIADTQSGSGLTKFDGRTWTVYNKTNSDLPTNSIEAIAIDHSGNIWAGTDGYGLVKFDGTNWTIYSISNSDLPDDDIQSLHVDANGILWIGTSEGLAQFDGFNWVVYNTSNSGLPVDFVSAIITDHSGNKWIGMGADYYNAHPVAWGLARFDGTHWKRYHIANSGLPSNVVNSILFDKEKNKWIGTSNGLALFDGTYWNIFNEDNSELTDNTIRDLALDGNGNVLVAAGGDLAIFDGVNWTNYNYEDIGLGLFNVVSLAVDGAGNIWIGTGIFSGWGNGLVKFDGTTWTMYDTTNSELPDNAVQCVTTDATGNVWLGTYSEGLVCFDGTNWTVYNTSNSDLTYNSVRCLTFDTAGNLWIGTKDESSWSKGSLIKFDGVNWTVHSGETYPNVISIDDNGDLWIGTADGLLKFDGNDWTDYDAYNSGLPSRTVNDVAIDSDGNKWVGTGEGLAIFKEGGPANAAIAVTPDVLSANLTTGSRATQNMTISNTGGGELSFGISVVNSQNYALRFDGENDYVRVANDIGNDFTISVWIKTTDTGGTGEAFSGDGIIWADVWGNANDMIPMALVGSKLGFGTGNSAGLYNTLLSNSNINTGNWIHVAVTRIKSNGTKKIYINGINESTTTGVTGTLNVNPNLDIGGNTLDKRYFNGIIDNLCIWNKVRTANEIQADTYREISGTEPGLVGYWRFDETSGNKTFDMTTTGNHGLLKGGVTRILSTAPINPAWLSVSPVSGTVPPGLSQDIEVVFDATNVSTGEMNATLLISSNDLVLPEIRVPLHLTVNATDVNEAISDQQIPKSYLLFQNFPNPFNPTTQIRFGLPQTCVVKIELFNINGKLVQTLIDSRMNAGYHTINFDGNQLASGLYFYRIQAQNFVRSKKMILMK